MASNPSRVNDAMRGGQALFMNFNQHWPQQQYQVTDTSVTIPREQYERAHLVVVAARTGDSALIKLAVDHLDKYLAEKAKPEGSLKSA